MLIPHKNITLGGPGLAPAPTAAPAAAAPHWRRVHPAIERTVAHKMIKRALFDLCIRAVLLKTFILLKNHKDRSRTFVHRQPGSNLTVTNVLKMEIYIRYMGISGAALPEKFTVDLSFVTLANRSLSDCSMWLQFPDSLGTR